MIKSTGMLIAICIISALVAATGSANQKTVKITPLGDPPLSFNKRIIPPDSVSEDLASLDYTGRVDRIENSDIVINDTLHYLSKNSKIYNASGKTASRSGLRKGVKVEYDVNKKNYITRLKILN